jgi:hypothetical protein
MKLAGTKRVAKNDLDLGSSRRQPPEGHNSREGRIGPLLGSKRLRGFARASKRELTSLIYLH